MSCSLSARGFFFFFFLLEALLGGAVVLVSVCSEAVEECSDAEAELCANCELDCVGCSETSGAA